MTGDFATTFTNRKVSTSSQHCDENGRAFAAR